MKSLTKNLILIFSIFTLNGCGTLGGAVSGAGDDLKKAGEWIKAQYIVYIATKQLLMVHIAVNHGYS